MRRSWWPTAGVALVAVLAAGCDGSIRRPDVTDGAASDGPDGLGDYRAPVRDLAAAADTLPRDYPPPPRYPPTVVVPGSPYHLVGDTISACSHQRAGNFSAERWCAFTMRRPLPGATELWVINVTRAIGGAAVRCDPAMPDGDPSCKRLTSELWTAEPAEGPAHPETHRFEGDTLIFHAQSRSTLDAYVGPIFAWRPGWPEARQLSRGQRALTCSAHASAELAWCIEDLTETGPLRFDLTAGPLGGLKTIARIVPTRPGTMSSQWGVTFTRSGDYLVYSTGGTTPDEVESLYLVRTADLATAATVTPTKVADDLSRWRLSVDGRQIHHLRRYNYSTGGDPAGDLMVADFPALTGERLLATRVALFQVLSDGSEVNRGLAYVQDVVGNQGTYKIMRDIARPAATSTVAAGASSITLSPDLEHVFYATRGDRNVSDRWVGRADGAGAPCRLVAASNVQLVSPGPVFSPDSRLVFWADSAERDGAAFEGWYSPVEGCGPSSGRKFADRIATWLFDGGDRIFYAENHAATMVDLKVAPLGGGAGVGAFIRQARIGRRFAILPGFEVIVFTIAGAATSDGFHALVWRP